MTIPPSRAPIASDSELPGADPIGLGTAGPDPSDLDPTDPAQIAPDAFFPAEADDPASRPLLLVLPGGGYIRHADHEAEAMARWFAARGLNTAVYRYPVAPHRHPVPIAATRTLLSQLRLGRHGDFDTTRIGVLGFSAAGHLAATLSNDPTGPERAEHGRDDRPDLAILAYPVISMTDLPHAGSLEALLGSEASIPERAAADADRLVDEHTPPTFLWHTADDASVPLVHSLDYARALSLHGVPVDLHVYADGGHGAGLATGQGPLEGWSGLAIEWLRGHGWC